MTTPNNYEPVEVLDNSAEVSVPIDWPFTGTLADLYIYQQNTDTGEVKYYDDGGFVAIVELVGEAYSVNVENYWGEGTDVVVTVRRATNKTQDYNQPDGQALDPYALEAALDKLTRALQEVYTVTGGQEPITSINPFVIPDRNGRASTYLGFDADGYVKFVDLDSLLGDHPHQDVRNTASPLFVAVNTGNGTILTPAVSMRGGAVGWFSDGPGSLSAVTDGQVEFQVVANQGIALKTGGSVNKFSTDSTLAGNSGSTVPTESAVKGYVDSKANVDGLSTASSPQFNRVTSEQGFILPGNGGVRQFGDTVVLSADSFAAFQVTKGAFGTFGGKLGALIRNFNTDPTLSNPETGSTADTEAPTVSAVKGYVDSNANNDGLSTTSNPVFATLKLSNLPVVDPLDAGAIWNDGGTLKISAG